MEKPIDILSEFPVRKSKTQKQAFREAITGYLHSLGYAPRVEEGALGSRNLVIGDSENAAWLVTAHYDTCARLLFPNMAFPFSLILTLLWQGILTAGIFLIPVPFALILRQVTGSVLTGWCLWGLLFAGLILLLLAGPANPSCVNDNTSGVITLLEIARELPERARGRVCFVLFDLEEAGLWGSASYEKAHSEACSRQIVLNLDCVGDGNHIAFIPGRQLRANAWAIKQLSRCGGWFGKKRIFIVKKGFSFYPSDQMNFPLGVGICALRRKKKLLYLGRIHTKKDTILDYTNVNLLRAAIISLISVQQ